MFVGDKTSSGDNNPSGDKTTFGENPSNNKSENSNNELLSNEEIISNDELLSDIELVSNEDFDVPINNPDPKDISYWVNWGKFPKSDTQSAFDVINKDHFETPIAKNSPYRTGLEDFPIPFFVDQLEEANDRLSDLQQEYDQLQEEHNVLQEKHNELQEKYDQLQQDCNELQKDHQRITELPYQTALETTNGVIYIKFRLGWCDKVVLERGYDNIVQLKSNDTLLDYQLYTSDPSEENEDLSYVSKVHLLGLQDKIKSLEEEVEQLKDEKESIRDEKNQVALERYQLRCSNRVLAESIDHIKKINSELEEENKSLKEKTSELDKANSELESQLAEKIKNMSLLKKTNELLVNNTHNQKKELEENATEIVNLQEEVINLQSGLDKYKTLCMFDEKGQDTLLDEQKAINKSLSAEIEGLKATNESLTHELNKQNLSLCENTSIREMNSEAIQFGALNLKREYDALSEQYEKLKVEKEQLEHNLQTAGERAMEQEYFIQAAGKKITDLSNNNLDLVHSRKNKLSDIDYLKKQLYSIGSECNQYEKERDSYKFKCHHLDKTLDRLKDENKKLREVVNAQCDELLTLYNLSPFNEEQAIKFNNELLKEIAYLNLDMEKLKKTNSDYLKGLDKFREQKKILKKSLSSKKAELFELWDQNNELKEKLKDVEYEFNAVNEENASLWEEIDSYREAYNE